MACVRKGGKRISHPRGDFSPMGGGLTHGGISHLWLVSRRVGKGFPTHGGISHPWGDFSPMGGFLTHGLCQEGWETDFPPTGGFLTHGGGSHPWGDFPPMACVEKGGKGISHPRGDFSPMACVKKGGKGISHPRGDFPPTGGHPWGVLIVVCLACCCRAVRSCHRVRLCRRGCGGC